MGLLCFASGILQIPVFFVHLFLFPAGLKENWRALQNKGKYLVAALLLFPLGYLFLQSALGGRFTWSDIVTLFSSLRSPPSDSAKDLSAAWSIGLIAGFIVLILIADVAPRSSITRFIALFAPVALSVHLSHYVAGSILSGKLCMMEIVIAFQVFALGIFYALSTTNEGIRIAPTLSVVASTVTMLTVSTDAPLFSGETKTFIGAASVVGLVFTFVLIATSHFVFAFLCSLGSVILIDMFGAKYFPAHSFGNVSGDVSISSVYLVVISLILLLYSTYRPTSPPPNGSSHLSLANALPSSSVLQWIFVLGLIYGTGRLVDAPISPISFSSEALSNLSSFFPRLIVIVGIILLLLPGVVRGQDCPFVSRCTWMGWSVVVFIALRLGSFSNVLSSRLINSIVSTPLWLPVVNRFTFLETTSPLLNTLGFELANAFVAATVGYFVRDVVVGPLSDRSLTPRVTNLGLSDRELKLTYPAAALGLSVIIYSSVFGDVSSSPFGSLVSIAATVAVVAFLGFMVVAISLWIASAVRSGIENETPSLTSIFLGVLGFYLVYRVVIPYA